MEQEGLVAPPQVCLNDSMHALMDEDWMTCYSDSPITIRGVTDGEIPTWEIAAMMEQETGFVHTPDSSVSSASQDSDGDGGDSLAPRSVDWGDSSSTSEGAGHLPDDGSFAAFSKPPVAGVGDAVGTTTGLPGVTRGEKRATAQHRAVAAAAAPAASGAGGYPARSLLQAALAWVWRSTPRGIIYERPCLLSTLRCY